MLHRLRLVRLPYRLQISQSHPVSRIGRHSERGGRLDLVLRLDSLQATVLLLQLELGLLNVLVDLVKVEGFEGTLEVFDEGLYGGFDAVAVVLVVFGLVELSFVFFVVISY